MASGSYFPPPVKAVAIPKKSGGERTLGIPTVSDRIAQTVVKSVLEPQIDPQFHEADIDPKSAQGKLGSAAGGTIGCWSLMSGVCLTHHQLLMQFDIIRTAAVRGALVDRALHKGTGRFRAEWSRRCFQITMRSIGGWRLSFPACPFADTPMTDSSTGSLPHTSGNGPNADWSFIPIRPKWFIVGISIGGRGMSPSRLSRLYGRGDRRTDTVVSS